jgi:large subunit ribosomal protein L5
MNKMKEIRIEKITLNLGTGGPGEPLEKALKLLNKITNMKPIETKSKKRIPGWGIRPGLSIGAKVTIRGKKAEELLKRLLEAKENKLSPKNFDNHGNLSFGIPEYLDMSGVEYDMSIGIIGLEAAITLARKGYRIKLRSIKKRKIPKKHQITKQDAIEFIETKFNTQIGEKE